ncbi:hypothetical protein SAMN04488126_10188 [Bhargavaea beijingensis]|uniref:Uncharacterized protein n=1 Tax=Bhargavaea beijingensis TaxID=426756 RepID=A0A1G6XK38_9BACL|nr:hypothetical protein [Bhargavaea beijingensis]SDD78549.1 hypothetical protein SAMN04488126_10188 [Bhargavaea beijingensis]
MANFNKVYNTVEAVDKSDIRFWRELGVNIDSNKEKTSVQLTSIIRSYLNSYSIKEIKEIAELGEIKVKEDENKESLIDDLCNKLSDSQKLLILNLQDYMNRKKKTINQYFELHSNEESENYTKPISKIYSLYKKSPSHLFAIRTLNIWQNHSSGTIYGIDKEMDKSIVNKVSNEFTFEQKLRDKLYKASREENNYKIHSYCEIEGLYIILLYKEVNDISKEDFNEAIRNREIIRILFSIDSSKNLFEIKTKANFELVAIKEYLEETFEASATKIKEEPFNDVNHEAVRDSILKGKNFSGEQVDDFLVDRIKFRESPLENSPAIAFALQDIDISQSVYDAYEKGAISISSIKSVESISFRSHGTRRTIFSSILDNGNIIFQMNDSRLDVEKKRILKEKFFSRFGLPLYKQISNVGTIDGEADLVDYIMNSRNGRNLNSIEIKKRDELFKAGLLNKVKVLKRFCSNTSCTYEEIIEDGEVIQEDCPDCDSEVKTIDDHIVTMDNDKIDKYVIWKVKEICESSEWEFNGISNRKVAGSTFKFLKIENKMGKLFKVLVCTETISGLAFSKLKKFLDPTLIITVGQGSKAIERYSSGCFSAISFGNFYERDSNNLVSFLNKTFYTLELKTKNYISDAASESYLTVKHNIENPKVHNYTPADYEDDIYTILKDLFINVQKWGHEYIGHELPEGVFTLGFDEYVGKKIETNKLAFSYDCKLNTDLKGYNFSVGEKDKAIRYIRSLSETIELSDFTNSKHLDGHIFISNIFKQKNATNTYEDIRASISKYYDTEIVFLTNDALLYLHEEYRKNYELIENVKDLFFNLINKVLLASKGALIEKKHMEFIISKTLKNANKKLIDFTEVTSELTHNIDSLFEFKATK